MRPPALSFLYFVSSLETQNFASLPGGRSQTGDVCFSMPRRILYCQKGGGGAVIPRLTAMQAERSLRRQESLCGNGLGEVELESSLTPKPTPRVHRLTQVRDKALPLVETQNFASLPGVADDRPATFVSQCRDASCIAKKVAAEPSYDA